MVRSINCPGVAQHSNPIPNAAIHRGLLITSAILGKEPDTDSCPEDKERQIQLVFDSLAAILQQSGATPQDVVKLDLYLADKADRKRVNPHWLRLYPDPEKRPARQAHLAILPDGCCLQIVATAVLET